MQPVGTTLAEDSCLKYHKQNDVNPSAGMASPDVNVEKTGLNSDADLAPHQPGPRVQAPSSLHEKGIPTAPHRSDTGSTTVDDDNDNDVEDKGSFPEGGLRAWLVVLGAFCGSFSVFGIINSTAILLEYFSANQLKEYSPSQIGWIFGLSLFLTFFCGAPIGPIFDSYGPRALMFVGSILLILSMFLLGECTGK